MKLSDYFTTKKRTNGEDYATLRADRPDWLYEAVRDAHDSELPNDWRYNTCAAICASLDDNLDEHNLDNWAAEFAEDTTDISNSDLLAWLSGNLYRIDSVDEASRELAVEETNMMGRVRLGQFVVIEEMALTIGQAYLDTTSGGTS